MQINHPTTLTFDDHTRLDRLMCTLTGSRSPLAAMVRRKLETAVIIHSLDPDEDLVTSGRKVRYSIDGAKEAERILSWDRPIVGDESTICIQELRGLALLGLRAGQSISMSGDGGIETIEVEKVTVVLDQRVGRVHGRSRASSRAASIASLLQHVGLRVRRHIGTAVRRIQKGRTEAALMRLGDDSLWDIGITREEIPHVASIVVGLAPGPTPSGYAPGELERIHTLAAEISARGEKRMEADLRLIWPDGTPKWVRLRAQEVPQSDGRRVIGVLYDITERKYAEERSELIARELRHRIKNSLAVLQSIASQSIRAHAHPEDGLAALSGRLVALAAAAGSVSEEDWDNPSIVGLVDRVLAPHHDGDRSARFDLAGPDMSLPAGFASTLALALHELATNAVKYGALSIPGGRVWLMWRVDGERRLVLTWTETGGPSVSPPDHAGFGTRMIERALFTPYNGHASLSYTSAGVHCRIVASIPA